MGASKVRALLGCEHQHLFTCGNHGNGITRQELVMHGWLHHMLSMTSLVIKTNHSLCTPVVVRQSDCT